MSRTCVSVAAVCVLLAAPGAGQERALRGSLDNMAEQIALLLNDEARRTPDKRLRVTFRPARTVQAEIDIYCRALSFGLRDALLQRVQSRRNRLGTFDVVEADPRVLEPPDVTMLWEWNGAESVEVKANVLLADGRRELYSDVLAVAELEERERACLFTFHPREGDVEAKKEGVLRKEPTSALDRALFERRFGAGETFFVVGELSSEADDGVVWSVVLEEKGFLFAANLAGGAADRERDAAAFEAARRSDTVSAYDGYLSAWPSGAHASEARGLRAAAAEREREERDAAAFAAARQADTVSAYEEYIEAWPSGAHVSDARRFLEAARVPSVGSVFRDCPHCPEMVVVPAGEFMMGSPPSEEGRYDDEGPQRGVTIGSAFAVGVYEVTRGEFGRFVSSTGRSMGDSCWTWENGEVKFRSGRGWRNPGFSQRDSHPVVCVSWDDARAYVRWLPGETGESYRLLSESEWEYAARGGTQTRYHWGDSSSSQCRYANGADLSAKKHNSGWTVADCDDGYYRTSPVGSFAANAFGLHDVHGNVWEWVRDCWNDRYAGAPDDGSAWESGDCSLRVLRGGSWVSVPWILRAALRYGYGTGVRNDYLGFRVARTFTS